MKVNIGRYPKNNDERKVSVKIEKHDTWNLDQTLANIIHPALLQLKATKYGTPYVEQEDAPHISRAKGEFSEYDYSADAWKYVIDEMIYTMQQIKDNLPGEEEFYEETIDLEGLRKYNGRLQNGCRLFGVYFRALWD